MIVLDQLTFTYPNQSAPALTSINWQVKAGAFVLLVGESGCGKSTLLRCLNGLVPHFSGGRIEGEVWIDGLNPITEGPTRLSQQVGFVGQSPEAQAVLDVVEAEVAFALENKAVPPNEMRQRVDEALALLALTGLRKRPLSTLSGGERQRVAIASALALRPKLLLLDEPTSQLDPESAAALLTAVTQLNKKHGLTIILVEHRLERVLPFVDKLLHLANGRLLHHGTVQEVSPHLPHLPPVAELGRRLGWQPLPLTVEEFQHRETKMQKVVIHDNPSGVKPAICQSKQMTSDRLRVTDLTITLGGKPTLKDVSLNVQAGETVALLGRNGAGKTTLLRGVVNLLAHEAGEVWVNDRLTADRKTAVLCREVGYLPQHPDDLLFAETVREELAVTLQNHGQLATGEQIVPLLNQLGLAELASRYPRDLSVGQRQRVALGAVTVTTPKLLLLDEPTRGLDYAAKTKLVAIWQQWLAQGMGLLLVTHDVELVAQIANRVIILQAGEVIAAGSTKEVLLSEVGEPFRPEIGRLFGGQGWLTSSEAMNNLIKENNT